MRRLFPFPHSAALPAAEPAGPVKTVRAAGQDAEPAGRALQYGVCTLLRGGGIVDDPKTSTGKSVLKPVLTRERETDRIPPIRGKYMACQYRLSNLPGHTVRLRRVLRHPGFTLPDGTSSTGPDFMITRRTERGEVFAFDACALHEDCEMVAADRVFRIRFRDSLLVEQKFTTERAVAGVANAAMQ